MDDQVSVPYRFAKESHAERDGNTRPRHFSPRAGLLAVSRVYRHLMLAPKEMPPGAGIQMSEQLNAMPAGVSDWVLMESLILCLADGLDYSHEGDYLLRLDPYLTGGLGYELPSALALEKYVDRLGMSSTQTGFQDIILSHVKAIYGQWESKRTETFKRLPNQVTLDLITVHGRGEAQLGWDRPAGEFPARVACLWREADLLLAGGTCTTAPQVREVIERAMEGVPQGEKCALFCAGPIADHDDILEFLRSKRFRHSIAKIRHGNVARDKTEDVGLPYLVGTRLDSAQIQTLGRKPGRWMDCASIPGVQCLHSEDDVLLRQKSIHPAVNFEYAALKTNIIGTPEDHLAAGFAARAQINRAADDLAVLAAGSGQVELTPGGRGRYLAALLAYNLCSSLRNLCLSDGEGLSISRFRARCIQTVGQLSRRKNQRWLRIHDHNRHEDFKKIFEIFEVDEKATTVPKNQRRPRNQNPS